MLYLIGLGLHDPSDVTVKGLQIIKTASRVFLEAYTSILGVGKDELVKHHNDNYYPFLLDNKAKRPLK